MSTVSSRCFFFLLVVITMWSYLSVRKSCAHVFHLIDKIAQELQRSLEGRVAAWIMECVYSEVMSSNHHKTVRTSLLLHSFLTSQLLYFPTIIVIVDVLGRIPSCCWLGFRMLIDWKESDEKQVLFSNTYRLPRLKKNWLQCIQFHR